MTGQTEGTHPHSLPKCHCTFPPPYICFWHVPAWQDSPPCPPLHQAHPLSLSPVPPCRHSSCGPSRPVTKDTGQHAFSQRGWKSLTFVSCTPTWSLLNRCLAGRAQMWWCSHGDLGRSLSRIIFQKGVCAVLFPIILLACTFQVLDNLWYSKNPIRTGYEKVFKLCHGTGIWIVEGNSKWESHWPGLWRFPFECNLPCNVINGNQISLVLRLPMESSDKCGNCN